MAPRELPTPAAFLETVTGMSARELNRGPQGRTFKLGTVDPNYGGTGRPKIIFDGESAVSTATYPYVGYTPTAGDRVVLAPVGNTYVILGKIDSAGGGGLPTNPAFDTVTVNETVSVGDEVTINGTVYGKKWFVEEGTQYSFTVTSWSTGFPLCGVAFTAPSSGNVLITVGGFVRMDNSSAGGRSVYLSSRVMEGSNIGAGTIVADGDVNYSLRIGAPPGFINLQANVIRPITGLTPGADYNVITVNQVGGSNAQGTISGRMILVEAI